MPWHLKVSLVCQGNQKHCKKIFSYCSKCTLRPCSVFLSSGMDNSGFSQGHMLPILATAVVLKVWSQPWSISSTWKLAGCILLSSTLDLSNQKLWRWRPVLTSAPGDSEAHVSWCANEPGTNQCSQPRQYIWVTWGDLKIPVARLHHMPMTSQAFGGGMWASVSAGPHMISHIQPKLSIAIPQRPRGVTFISLEWLRCFKLLSFVRTTIRRSSVSMGDWFQDPRVYQNPRRLKSLI